MPGVYSVWDSGLSLHTVAAHDGKGLEEVPALAERHGALAAINAGFFTFRPDTAGNGLSSVSLIVQQGQLLAPNEPQLFRNGMAYFPTRGAFGIRGKMPDVAWVYTDSLNGQTYEYAVPNPLLEEGGQAVPGKRYPVKRKRWKVSEAVGGGPVLVNRGRVQVTDEEELFTGIAGMHPRTAVGYTAKREIVFFVCDGRQEASAGLTLVQLAGLMQGLGCVEALNLDGGGSTTLVAGGTVINRPSDKQGPRKVASVLILK